MHKCPVKSCDVRVSSELVACRPHWYMLPIALRNAIWEAYRTRRSNPGGHAAALRAALDWWKANAK
jgi:hypothetical protein